MKKLLVLMMLFAPSALLASDYWPGYAPNWNDRFSVCVTMTNNATGDVNFSTCHGSLDYVQSSSLVLYLREGQEAWYNDLADRIRSNPQADDRMIPQKIVDIEKKLAQ